MTRRKRGRTVAWLTAGAALLGAATLLVQRTHVAGLRAMLGARYDEASGRGRAGTPAAPLAIEAGHETSDMRGGLMAKLVLLLGSVAFCMVFAMVGLRLWVTQLQRGSEPAPTAIQTARIIPPDPHLQRDPLREIAQLRARETRLLDSYGYVDAGKTRARIPLDRAMALTVGQPLAAPP